MFLIFFTKILTSFINTFNDVWPNMFYQIYEIRVFCCWGCHACFKNATNLWHHCSPLMFTYNIYLCRISLKQLVCQVSMLLSYLCFLPTTKFTKKYSRSYYARIFFHTFSVFLKTWWGKWFSLCLNPIKWFFYYKKNSYRKTLDFTAKLYLVYHIFTFPSSS